METTTFLIGLTLALGMALTVAAYLRAPLNKLLLELCGTAERAAFWAAFAQISVVLVPVMFALHQAPLSAEPAVVDLAMQIKWTLAGLITTVVLIAMVLGRFVRWFPDYRYDAQSSR